MEKKSSKKDPADLSVEEKLKSLYKLQTILSEIDRIRTLRGELPLEVQDLEDEIAGLKTRCDNNHADVMRFKKSINENRSKAEQARNFVARYMEQQNNVRNNREYDSLAKEIEFQNLEIELADKRIREAHEIISAKEEEINRISIDIDEKLQDLDIKKSELDSIVEETRVEEDKLRMEVKSLELNIEPRLLQSFKRIRKNTRNGLGIVYVQRDACGGCFNKIPPQRQLDISLRKKIIVCEYCGRIIIDPELAGVQFEKVEQPAPKKRSERKKATATKED